MLDEAYNSLIRISFSVLNNMFLIHLMEKMNEHDKNKRLISIKDKKSSETLNIILQKTQNLKQRFYVCSPLKDI